jgi:pimeloyl-ACP methyl ester carboxylesterase
MPFFTYQGLEYLDSNPTAGQTMLVLHWGGASARVGLPFAHLLPDWRIIAPSLRGHGRNPPPTASAQICARDVLDVLAHLSVTQVARLYAYSLGGYIATRLFGQLDVAQGALLAGGVVPLGVALPNVFDESATEQPETASWLAEQRAQLDASGKRPSDAETEWAMMYAAYEDIFDLSRPRLTFRLSPEAMRPTLTSVWHDDYFARPAPTPTRLLFWNGNHPVACRPYVEQFTRHPGCHEITLDFDPFDVRLDVVARAISLLDA